MRIDHRSRDVFSLDTRLLRTKMAAKMAPITIISLMHFFKGEEKPVKRGQKKKINLNRLYSCINRCFVQHYDYRIDMLLHK